MERVRNNTQGQRLNQIRDLVVVGAGIHGAFLLRRVLRDRIVAPERVLWLDAEPRPFALWRRRVSNCRMDFLRSPASHGLDPDFRALRCNLDDPERFAPPYHRPAVRVFDRHLSQVEDEVLAAVDYHQTTVLHLERVAESHWLVVCADRSIATHKVILALGQPEPRLPAALRGLPVGDNVAAPIYHLYDRTIPDTVRRRPTLLVGNGIGAAHVALWYAEAGRTVDWWMRSESTVYDFDSNPAYIGPKGRAELAAARRDQTMPTLLARARRRGSVPPGLAQRLARVPDGLVRRRCTGLVSARYDGRRFVVRDVTGSVLRPEVIVLATGFVGGPPAPALIAASAEQGLPIDSAGYPLLDDRLQWGPGLFVSGGLAEMVLGPPARNIIGAHLAGRRIIPTLRRAAAA